MMQIAAKLGVQRFAKYQKLFGMGQKTGIDLPGEAYGLIYNADNMGPTDLAVNSFGQSYNSTMIQMAAAFASVINGGSYYEPHVVKQILNDQGSVVKKIEPNLVRETVSQSTSDFIRHALFMTVDDEEGTGKAERRRSFRVPPTTISYPSVDLRRRMTRSFLCTWSSIPRIFRAKSRRTALSPQRFSRRSWRKRFHT